MSDQQLSELIQAQPEEIKNIILSYASSVLNVCKKYQTPNHIPYWPTWTRSSTFRPDFDQHKRIVQFYNSINSRWVELDKLTTIPRRIKEMLRRTPAGDKFNAEVKYYDFMIPGKCYVLLNGTTGHTWPVEVLYKKCSTCRVLMNYQAVFDIDNRKKYDIFSGTNVSSYTGRIRKCNYYVETIKSDGSLCNKCYKRANVDILINNESNLY